MGKNICNIFLLSLLSCFLFGETKIGYIDSQIILTQYEDVRQVQVELEKEQKKLQAVYEKNFLSLDSLKSAYESRSMIMSEQKQQEMIELITNKEKEMQEWQLKYFGPEGELYKMQNELMAPILRTIDKAINSIGQVKGYNYIFDAASGGIVYALDAHNITQDVLDELTKINIPDLDEKK